jgi:hypothetical protein
MRISKIGIALSTGVLLSAIKRESGDKPVGHGVSVAVRSLLGKISEWGRRAQSSNTYIGNWDVIGGGLLVNKDMPQGVVSMGPRKCHAGK